MLFYKFKEWIIGVWAILAFILFIYLKGKGDGESGAKSKALEALGQDRESAKNIRDSVENLSPSELDDRLSVWTRKG